MPDEPVRPDTKKIDKAMVLHEVRLRELGLEFDDAAKLFDVNEKELEPNAQMVLQSWKTLAWSRSAATRDGLIGVRHALKKFDSAATQLLSAFNAAIAEAYTEASRKGDSIKRPFDEMHAFGGELELWNMRVQRFYPIRGGVGEYDDHVDKTKKKMALKTTTDAELRAIVMLFPYTEKSIGPRVTELRTFRDQTLKSK